MPVRKQRLGSWKLVTPNGIQVNDQDWNTGSVWAVCPLSGDRLLMGTEQGGLWLSEPDATGAYQSRCLSNDWDHWGFQACVQDPANSNRVFFGSLPGLGGVAGVYIGDFDVQPDAWTFVPLPPSISAPQGAFSDNPLPSGVIAMTILPLQRLLVVATGAGIGWMQIDSQPFTWNSVQHSIIDLANLPGDDFLFISTAASAGHSTAPPTQALNKGSISGGTAFTSVPIPASAIRWTRRPGRPKHSPIVTPLRIASCRNHPENLYCLGRVQRADTPQLFIIRSQDAGATWRECAYDTNLASESLSEVLDFFDVGPKSPFSIAVHPINPEIVASGFGGAALSTDGGIRWNSLTSLQGWHPDVHELLFHLEPLPKGRPGSHKARRYSLYIPSDGGILKWSGADSNVEFAASLLVADSSRNRSLPIVMLYSPDGRRDAAFGNLSIAGGAIAAGSQDNANLWLDLESPIWRHVFQGGDGGATALSNQGISSYALHSQSLNNIPVRMSRRASATAWGLPTTVPIRLNATTLDATGIIPVFLRPVKPEVGLVSGAQRSPVIALASPAKSSVVYAAVIATLLDPAGALVSQQVEWNIFGQLPAGETVTCLEAHNSSAVLAGTISGRIFLLKEQASPAEASFQQKPTHPIRGIASNGTTIACFETTDLSAVSVGGTAVSFLYAGQFRQKSLPGKGRRGKNLALVDASAFLRNDGHSTFRSIDVNRSRKNVYLSFALTVDENEVWVCLSSDPAHWRRHVTGLPRAIRCSDVVFSESARGGELLLSSYGRAVWRLIF